MSVQNRFIYNSAAVFVSNSPATGAMSSIVQLHRVTSAAHSFTITRQDVNQLAQLAAVDRIIIAAPTVNLEIGYNVSNVLNESRVGLYVGGDQTALKYLLDGTQDDKNYFIREVPNNNDAAGYTGVDGGVIGIGNGFISSFTTQGAVGAIPSATLRVEGSNIKFDNHSDAIISPAVNPYDGTPINQSLSIPTAVAGVSGQVGALQPGQIQVDIDGAGLGLSGLCIQSYNIGVELRREPLQCLGSRFPFARVATFPITVSVDIEANVQEFGVGNLTDILCNDGAKNITVALYSNTCTGIGDLKARYIVRGAKLDSQNVPTTIGPSVRATLRYSAQVGGPQDTLNGLFIDGSLN